MTGNPVMRAIRGCGPLREVRSVLTAVSGGPDSVVLLHGVRRYAEERGLSIEAAHLEHGIRGEESRADRDFVESLCARWKIPLHVGAERLADRAREQGENLEALARKARYDFLARTARERGLLAVLTAHTLDDVAETMVLNFFRGASSRGLRGMSEVTIRGGVRLIRPLLNVSRAEILEYAKMEGLPYRLDSTNLDLGYDRNWVRHVLLPLLGTRYPSVREVLARTASGYREDESFLSRLARKVLRGEGAILEEGYCVLPVDFLERATPALVSRTIREVLERVMGKRTRSSIAISQIREMLAGGRTTWELDLPGGVRAAREYEVIRFSVSPEDLVSWEPIAIRVPGEIPVPCLGIALRTELLEKSGRFPENCEKEVEVDAGIVGEELVLRPVRPGDRLMPLGMRGTRKVKDILIDAKIPRRKRGQVPFLCRPDGLPVWLVGFRMDERVKVSAETRRILRIELCDRERNRKEDRKT